MKITLRTILSSALYLNGLGGLRAQIVWSFTDGTGAPSATVANLSGGVLSAGNLAGTSSLAFNTTSASTNSGASGGNNAAVRTVASASLSPSSSTYFEFTVTPANGHQISATGLTLGSRSAGTGPTTLSLFSSVDSFSSALGSIVTSTNSTWTSVTLSSFSVAAAANTPVTFRLYGAPSGTTTSANWRVDDLSFSVSAISAIPEPSTYAALAGAAALGGAAWRRRRRPRSPDPRV